MSKKSRQTRPATTKVASRAAASPTSSRQPWLLAGLGTVLVIGLVALVAWSFFGGTQAPAKTPPAGTVIQGIDGTWTNIEPDTLAAMLSSKDFTLLNVKTPYVGEIAGTDLYVPFDQVARRANELPQNKHAEIVVYCRTGHESAVAAQTLLDLGYDNIKNLDGGMTAWTASGRSLVMVDRPAQ